ncbi:MAG TPA: hypothetical protein VK571_07840 [Gemmatimonadaceae bacterium]|nr:hypothetical protein [Gemmatimonadaceae bacterium]
MIVIGVAPGLKALTYSVLEIRPSVRPTVIDKDVLLGPKLPGRDDEMGFLKGLVELGKKAYVHHLIMEVVLERALVPVGHCIARPRGLLVIGPACNPKEPPEHVMAVRVMLRALAGQFGTPSEDMNEAQMQALLEPTPRESWFRVANRTIDEPLDTDDRKIVLAVAVSLAGGLRARREGRAL